eukprot:TRINITY_DN1359_c0_g1_i2.p1 TRINITY_DN1359_c0_g1~~TRINITY_DN1359_c0_g1_i2.p1  ORF type:complete len:300 (-),score=62.23 TRINITY_DN1359_c0_g1_i2:157-1056(-)
MVTVADRDLVVQIFKKFDDDGNGLIDAGELRNILQEIDGDLFSDDQVDDVFREADYNRDGKIAFQEFIDWMWAEEGGAAERLVELGEPIVCGGRMGGDVICGGFGPKQPANEEVQGIADQVKDAALEKANMLLMEGADWKAVQYSSQVVAGTNYDIDVDTGNSGCLNIRVYVDLEGNIELTNAAYLKHIELALPFDEPIICGPEMVCGGFGGKQPANEEVQGIADQVKDAALEKANMLLLEGAGWKAVQYSSQVVAGTNYDIDVDTGNSGCLNILVYVDLEGNVFLTNAASLDSIELAA